jgi:hypothetical protein
MDQTGRRSIQDLFFGIIYGGPVDGKILKPENDVLSRSWGMAIAQYGIKAYALF